MRPLRALLIYLAVVLLGGALLAPWLWQLAQAGAQHFPDLLGKTAGQPFHRYLHRSMLALALLGLWPFMRQLGARSRADLGLARPIEWRKIFSGFALGFGSLAVLVGLAWAGHARAWNPNLTLALAFKTCFNALLTAAVVSTLEEILFRGGVFGGVRRVFDWWFALALSSCVFALVHFFQRAELAGPIGWTSGFELLPKMLGGFFDVQKLIPGFINLALVGALLALAYQRTGRLWFSIGLHAGWIFWMKSAAVFAGVAPGTNTWFWGSNALVDGWLASLVLLATFALLTVALPMRREGHPPNRF